MKGRSPNARLMRWSLMLQSYDFEIVFKSGSRHTDADHLSRHSLANTTELSSDEYPEVMTTKTLFLTSEIQEEIAAELKGADVGQLQRDDPFYKKYFEILEHPLYSEKQKRKRARKYEIIDNQLYRKEYVDRQVSYKLCIPNTLVSTVLKACHDAPLAAAHGGRNRIYGRTRLRYYWPGTV